jgi:PEP-CTERM motif-containing protein
MIHRPIRVLAFTAIFLCLIVAQNAAAQIVFLGAGGSPRTDGGKVVGISLNSFGQTITSLGFYDHNQDGISGNYQLGLWDASQNLLATATVTPSSPLTGDFRYAAINPVTIGTFANPQSFTIGVLLPPNPSDIWLDNALLTLFFGYTGAGTGQFSGPSGTLVYPANIDSTAYYVVNANGPAPPVPEPSTMAIASLAAAIGMLAARRRRD